jgi:aromatic-L-amino-acid/L-tryptophan decarboxylase
METSVPHNRTSDPFGGPTGDMPPEEFRAHAHAVADWIADYLAEVGEYSVLARVEPGDTAARIPVEPPETGEPMAEILADFRRDLMPGVTHWNHPGFFAYFAITGSGPGILGEMLAAALNVNAMLWRTGPAVTELEARALDWLRQMLGLPEGFAGTIQDTASISSLTAIAAAREAALPEAREEGLSGGPRLRLYCSREAHSSIEKAGITLGLGRAGTRTIPSDAAFRMDTAALEAAIAEDRAAGWLPFCVVATVGTTSTTSVDPVPEIGRICRREGLWLHVDAAYAGAAAVAPEFRDALDGCDAADSFVVNPHKWLFVPIDCSALFVRRPELVRRAFSVLPEYLVTPEGETVTNLMDYGPALGRRFRALKLWMTLRYFGREGIAARIREHVRLARLFAAWVDRDPAWELVAPVPFSTVVFRHSPPGVAERDADALNERILARVNASGEVYLSHTRLAGRFALRLAVGNLRTEERHVARAWALLREAAESIGGLEVPAGAA